MYAQVATKLALTSSDSTEYSQSVAMGNDNAVFVEMTVFNAVGTTDLDVYLQVSNDLDNWEDFSGTPTIANTAAAGYFTGQESSVASAYVRLRYDLASGNQLVLGAGINTASL